MSAVIVCTLIPAGTVYKEVLIMCLLAATYFFVKLNMWVKPTYSLKSERITLSIIKEARGFFPLKSKACDGVFKPSLQDTIFVLALE